MASLQSRPVSPTTPAAIAEGVARPKVDQLVHFLTVRAGNAKIVAHGAAEREYMHGSPPQRLTKRGGFFVGVSIARAGESATPADFSTGVVVSKGTDHGQWVASVGLVVGRLVARSGRPAGLARPARVVGCRVAAAVEDDESLITLTCFTFYVYVLRFTSCSRVMYCCFISSSELTISLISGCSASLLPVKT